MKAQPLIIKTKGVGYEECTPEEATHIRLNMPGPIPTRILPIIIKGKREGTNCWTWNGSTDLPTIKPSILTKDGMGTTCHSHVNDGKAIFLDDSTHEFAGQTIDLLDIQ